MYHSTLTECLRRIKTLKDKGQPPNKIAIMVASHNEDTVRFAIEKYVQVLVRSCANASMLDQLHAAGTASKAVWLTLLCRSMNIIALDSGGTKFALGNVQQEFRNTLKLIGKLLLSFYVYFTILLAGQMFSGLKLFYLEAKFVKVR